MKRLVPFWVAAGSGLAMSLALPLVVRALSLRELDPAGWLEPVAWVALVPAILALRAAPRPGRAALLGLAAGLAYFYASIHWVSHAMTAFGGVPGALAFLGLTLLVGYMAAHWAAAFAISAALRARLGWPLWAQLPPVWAALELCRNYFLTGFPWANLGYTQVRTPWVAQLASATGVYGIAALVVLVNAVLAEVIAARREHRPAPGRALAVAGAAVVLTLAYGAAHLSGVRDRMQDAPSFSVGIVQPNVDQSRKNRARDNAGYILPRLVTPTVEADRAGADLVVWPEASYPIYVPAGTRSFAGAWSGIPPLEHAHLLAGVATFEYFTDPETGKRRGRVANQNQLLSPSLEVLGTYQKNHLVPFGEYVPLAKYLRFLHQVVPSFAPSAPGAELVQLSFAPAGGGAPVRLAPMICFDAIFPEINLAYARQAPEPDVLVNATNDAWYGHSAGPYQFLAIVRMRAIEAERSVIRAAYAGVSAVILPTGEVAPGAVEVGPVEPEDAPREEPPRLLLADVPRLHGRTLYTIIGDAFAYACAAFTAAALAASIVRARRART
ncbi:MAG: apolipoprotein N-acyltransferase [Anaeromyxobacteraceae bacterium]